MRGHPSPLRLDAELIRSAEPVAAQMSRSVPEQIAHWARIGRELERQPDVSLDQIRKVLEGAAAYDALPVREQTLARAAWLERAQILREALNLEQEFTAAGYRYAESDESAAVTLREPKTRYRKSAGKRAARR